MSHVVVIGAGQAGSSCVAKLRAEGFEGEITLVGGEAVPPYQRPPLSKAYLLGKMTEERLYLRPASFYADNNIKLRLSTRATAIDVAAKTVTLENTEILPYDHLVLTTGAHPRTLPSAIGGDLDNVFCVRDLADANAMEPSFTQLKKALIVGGGYIGLEAAAVATSRGVLVTLVEMSDRILQRVACPETSDFFRDLHTREGRVDIREGTGLDRLVGQNGVLTGAVLSDGTTLEIDFAVVGVGILPATILAEGAGLKIENGIATNVMGQTSDPAIWAAGDCASAPLNGAHIRIESVGNAIDQAEAVAKNIMGANKPYTPKPWFWSDQYDCKLQIAGLNIGYDAVHVRAAGEARSHWYYKGDQLIAVDAMNDPRNYMIGKRLIEAGKSPTPAQIIDPNTDMKGLLKG